MWKRILMGCAVMAVTIFPLFMPAASSAVCSDDPPLPPGGFSWPASGPVIAGWTLDCRTDRGHRGIDIALAEGDPVRASATGVVIFTGYTPAEGGGMTVSIEHTGGMRTTYLHLAQLIVSQGDDVLTGQQLGTSTGAPLHFGMKIASGRETYFNPEVWMNPVEAISPAAGPDDTAAAVAGSDPGPLPAPTSEQPQSQPNSGMTTNVSPGNVAEPGVAMPVMNQAGQAWSINGSVTTPGHTIANGDPATLPLDLESLNGGVIAIGPAEPAADSFLNRLDRSSDPSQTAIPDASRSKRQPSRGSEGSSPLRYLLLACLLMTATAATGWLRGTSRQKPATAY